MQYFSLSFFNLFLFGDSYGNRTHVTGVRGRCLNRLTNEPLLLFEVRLLFFLTPNLASALVHHQGLEPGTP